MASATGASAERNPKATGVSRRSLVFTLSTRAFDTPWIRAASMPTRCSVMALASLTNAGMRHRRAHFSQASSRAMPSGPYKANTWRSCARTTTTLAIHSAASALTRVIAAQRRSPRRSKDFSLRIQASNSRNRR